MTLLRRNYIRRGSIQATNIQHHPTSKFGKKHKYLLPFDAFFKCQIHDKTSIILTSNKSPREWGEIIGEPGITTAILDRLIHRVEVIQFDDSSYRMKHRSSIFAKKVFIFT